MRAILFAALSAAVAAGCAGSRAAAKGDAPLLSAAGANAKANARSAVYVDKEHGFEIGRPNGGWTFKAGNELSTDSIDVPVVVANASSGAQVVVQVAPAVATPSQFAERLTTGLRTRAGFSTSEITPIPLADGAVGFDFAVANEVSGKVAILEGDAGRVYVLLATWPQGAPKAVETEVDKILGSMKAHP